MSPPEISAELSIRVLPGGTVLHRAHSVSRAPVFFGPGPGQAPRNRFDAPAGEYRVCYLGLSEAAAFIEGVVHRAVPRRIISEATIASRAITQVIIQEEIRAVRLHGRHLVGSGATAAVTHGSDYEGLSRPWSRAVYDHPSCADGILYTARHDERLLVLALFDRAAHKIAAGQTYLLSGTDLRTLRLLNRYRIGFEV